MTRAWAHSCTGLALLVVCSGVRFSKTSLLYWLLLLGLVPLWSVHVLMVVIDEHCTCLVMELVLLYSVLPIVWCSWMKDESDSILCSHVFVILAFVVLHVYFSVNVEDAISQEGGVCYGFKFNRNIRDGSGFILVALAPPEVLFASVARCLNRHCARHAAPNRMQWHQWPRTLIKWVPWSRYILCLIY